MENPKVYLYGETPFTLKSKKRLRWLGMYGFLLVTIPFIVYHVCSTGHEQAVFISLMLTGLFLVVTLFCMPLLLFSYLTVENRELVIRYGGVISVRLNKEDVRRVRSATTSLEITYNSGKLLISDCPEIRRILELAQIPIR